VSIAVGEGSKTWRRKHPWQHLYPAPKQVVAFYKGRNTAPLSLSSLLKMDVEAGHGAREAQSRKRKKEREE